MDDYVCTLYNKIVVNRADEPEAAVKASMYQPPSPDYNAVIVDFAAFRDIKDCMAFVQTSYDPRVLYVLFVSHNKVKLYPVVNFVSQVLNIPVV